VNRNSAPSTLCSGVQEPLVRFRDPSSWLGLLFFHEGNWYLSNDRVGSLIDSLCANHMIDKFRWVLRKGNTSLGLCRSWDGMNVNGSDLIDDAALFKPIFVASSWNASYKDGKKDEQSVSIELWGALRTNRPEECGTQVAVSPVR